MAGLHSDGPRVLIADEDPLVRWALRERLEEAGFRVVEAATGAQALERSTMSDAVLLGTPLPDLDGARVAIQIRRARPRCPLILLSSASPPVGRATDHGLGYMPKPFDVDAVVNLLGRAMRAR